MKASPDEQANSFASIVKEDLRDDMDQSEEKPICLKLKSKPNVVLEMRLS